MAGHTVLLKIAHLLEIRDNMPKKKAVINNYIGI